MRAIRVHEFGGPGNMRIEEVPDPERFGVVEFDDQRRVLSIEEKPAAPKSHYAVTGLYVFDNQVCQIAKALKPSPRGEIEIVDIQKHYLKKKRLDVRMFTGEWLDTGTFDTLLAAGQMVSEWKRRQKIRPGNLSS